MVSRSFGGVSSILLWQGDVWGATFAPLSLIAVLVCVTAIGAAQSAASRGDAVASVQLHQAVLAAKRGDSSQALRLAEALIASHPKYSPALKFEGSVLEQMGRDNEAERAYEAALQLAPKDVELQYKVGVARLLAGDTQEAIALFQQRLLQVPRDGDTLFYLAQAYHLQDENDLALKTIQRDLSVQPDSVMVWQKYGELLCSSGDNATALIWLTKAQHADPTLDRIDFDLGVASLRNEDLESAAQYAAKAVSLRSGDLRAEALLAEVDVKLSKWQEAEGPFLRVLAVKPKDPASLLGLGHCQLALKNYQAAVETLTRLLQLDQTIILAHFYLSRAYAGLGRMADADHEAELHSRLVEQAGSVVPTDERDAEKATLVQARQLLLDNHESEAIELFRQRAKGPTATPGAPYMLAGVVYLYMGRSEDAERLLKKALAIEPTVREAHTYLGLLALQQGDLEDAERDFRQELVAQPNSQLAVAELGEVRYRQQRWEDAAEQFVKSRTVQPALLYMLSDSYFHLGKVKEADLTAELAVGYAKDDLTSVQRVVDLLNRNQQTELAQRLSLQLAR
nr:tetratricopeptide repeat protein [Granulicella paludicola]